MTGAKISLKLMTLTLQCEKVICFTIKLHFREKHLAFVTKSDHFLVTFVFEILPNMGPSVVSILRTQ